MWEIGVSIKEMKFFLYSDIDPDIRCSDGILLYLSAEEETLFMSSFNPETDSFYTIFKKGD